MSPMSCRSPSGLVTMRSMLELRRTCISLHKICCAAMAQKSGWLEGVGVVAAHTEPGGAGCRGGGLDCCYVEPSSQGLESKSATTLS